MSQGFGGLGKMAQFNQIGEPTELELLQTFFGNQFKAIEFCIQEHLISQAMVLLYNGIDVAASLARPENAPDVTAAHFERWCAEFMKPEVTLGVTASDLYGARCGLLHANTSESKRWRQGNATRLFYCHGDRDADQQNAILNALGAKARFLKVERITKVLIDGLVEFFVVIKEETDIGRLARKRVMSQFAVAKEWLPPEAKAQLRSMGLQVD